MLVSECHSPLKGLGQTEYKAESRAGAGKVKDEPGTSYCVRSA